MPASLFNRFYMTCGICYFLTLLLFVVGCGEESQKQNRVQQPTVDSPGFVLEIEPVDDDPRNIVVVVTAKDASVWQKDSLSASSQDRDFRQLLTLQYATKGDSQDSNSVETISRKQDGDSRPLQLSILGSYEIDHNQLRFTPAFPLLAGLTYIASFDPTLLGSKPVTTFSRIQQTYHVPAERNLTSPKVLAIYPSGSVLPANHLKFYLLFSEPMQQGEIFGFFSLRNLTKEENVLHPFRHTELWSKDNRRLTLWFHPGRQKDGVNLNVEFGPVLNEGEEYRLIISGDWLSQRGVSLGKDVTKEFLAGPQDRKQPDLNNWKLTRPTAGTKDSLQCEFPQPLDWALLHSEVLVQKLSGQEVGGMVEVGENETVWKFTPRDPWQAAVYRLAVGSVLEDLAGNSLERPFEVDLTAKVRSAKSKQDSQIPQTLFREFEITASVSAAP